MTQLSEQVLPEGTQIGLYEIKNVLAIGQHAIIYRAWSEHLNASIVLKEYFPQQIALRNADGLTISAVNPNQQNNFQNGLTGFLELTEALVKIEHPNIVQTQNSLEFNGTAYMIMDFQDCASLEQNLQLQSTFTDQDFMALFIPLLDALQQAHSQGLVHGDIQPENILLSNNDKPMLVGFSVSSVAELSDVKLRPTAQSDLYQLAAIMYQCIQKQTPIALEDRQAAIGKGESDPLPPLLDATEPAVRQGLMIVISSMLSLDESGRPKTAKAAITAFKTYFSEETELGSILEGDSHPSTTPKSASLHPALWLSLAGGVALLVVISLFILPSEDTPTPEQPVAEQQTNITSEPQLVVAKPENEVIVRTETLQLLEQEEVGLASSESDAQADEMAGKSELNDSPATTDIATDIQTTQTTAPLATVDQLKDTETSTISETSTSTLVTSQKGTNTETIETVDTSTTLTDSTPTLSNWAKAKNLPLPEQIQWHLTEADKDLAALRLTTPLENNAYQHYRIILELDSDNAEAHTGMNNIVDYYAAMFTRAIEEGKLQRASIYLRRVEVVMPNAPVVNQMREQLITAEQ